MVTTYNTKDLVSFGNFLLEKHEVKHPFNTGIAGIQINVSHADIENWRDGKQKRVFDAFLSLKREDVAEEKRGAFDLIYPSLLELVEGVKG